MNGIDPIYSSSTIEFNFFCCEWEKKSISIDIDEFKLIEGIKSVHSVIRFSLFLLFDSSMATSSSAAADWLAQKQTNRWGWRRIQVERWTISFQSKLNSIKKHTKNTPKINEKENKSRKLTIFENHHIFLCSTWNSWIYSGNCCEGKKQQAKRIFRWRDRLPPPPQRPTESMNNEPKSFLILSTHRIVYRPRSDRRTNKFKLVLGKKSQIKDFSFTQQYKLRRFNDDSHWISEVIDFPLSVSETLFAVFILSALYWKCFELLVVSIGRFDIIIIISKVIFTNPILFVIEKIAFCTNLYFDK